MSLVSSKEITMSKLARILRLTLLASSLLLTTLAAAPARSADNGCSEWHQIASCCASTFGLRQREERLCCSVQILNCWNEYRCATYPCITAP
jgi:hypothetical protein